MAIGERIVDVSDFSQKTLHKSDSNWTVDMRANVGSQVYRILRERIIRNDLKPGSKISEPRVSRHYSVSRQPVREAFIKLCEEGLLEIRPQRSTLVHKIDYKTVLDGRFVREAVEAEIVKILAQNPTPAVIDELRAQIRAQEKINRYDIAEFNDCDTYFHRTLAEAAGKSKAWDFIESVKLQMDRVLNLSVHHFPHAAIIRQHLDIVQAIEQGEVVQAENAIRLHLKHILKTLPTLRKIYDEFFSE